MQAEVDRAEQLLAARDELAFAVLFGSAATEVGPGPKSDIDLAVRFAAGRRPSGWGYGGLLAELEAAFGRRVQLVDLETVRSTVLRFEIAKGQLVKGESDEWIRFQVRAFREWREFGPRFRRMAAALEAKIAERAGPEASR